MAIYLFRLDHRPGRDKRVTTHLFLAGRALGADKAFYSGLRDVNVEKSVSEVVKSWGGSFSVEFVDNWKRFIKNFNGIRIHLTMYGLPVQDVVKKINVKEDVLIIVGGSKVPSFIFDVSEYNVSVTSQPHSEISSLALFLRELNPNCYDLKFGGKEILPSERGKVFKN